MNVSVNIQKSTKVKQLQTVHITHHFFSNSAFSRAIAIVRLLKMSLPLFSQMGLDHFFAWRALCRTNKPLLSDKPSGNLGDNMDQLYDKKILC